MKVLRCQKCEKPLDTEKDAWRGYRLDAPDEDDHPILAFYCAECADWEFGLTPLWRN